MYSAPKLLNYLFCPCILKFSSLNLSYFRLMKAQATIIEHLNEIHPQLFLSLPFLLRQQILLGQGLLFFCLYN